MSRTISIIVSVDENYGIGYKNDLLAYISSDLKRFKQLTIENTVIMGRNTWNSLPKRPLVNRKNIVITRDASANLEGAVKVNSIEDAVANCPEKGECFIIGGAQIYKQFFDLTDKLYITKILKSFIADTFFPTIESDLWIVESESDIFTDEKSGLNYQYITYIRKK